MKSLSMQLASVDVEPSVHELDKWLALDLLLEGVVTAIDRCEYKPRVWDIILREECTISHHLCTVIYSRSLPHLGSGVQPVISPRGGERPAADIRRSKKPLPLYPPIRMLHVWLVFVHALVFTITADSNARRYWLSTNGFVTE